MKHAALFVFVLAGSCLFAAAAQAAPDRVGRLGIGVLAAGSSNEFADNAAFYQASVDYGVTPYFAIGVSGGWQKSGGDSDDQQVGVVPVFATFIVRSPDFHDNFVPYGLLGLGIVGAYVEDEDGNDPDNSGDDVDDVAFGWKLGAGVEYLFSPNWALNLEIAFTSSSADLMGIASGDDDIQYWTFGGGIKYTF